MVEIPNPLCHSREGGNPVLKDMKNPTCGQVGLVTPVACPELDSGSPAAINPPFNSPPETGGERMARSLAHLSDRVNYRPVHPLDRRDQLNVSARFQLRNEQK
jgi:hypothetical protein